MQKIGLSDNELLDRAPAGAEADNYAGAGPAAGDDNEWLERWGFDLCMPGGLCERVYERLGMPMNVWPALKALPEVRLGSPCTSCWCPPW